MAGQETGRVRLAGATVREHHGARETSRTAKHSRYGLSLVWPNGRELFLAAETDKDKQEWLAYLEKKVEEAEAEAETEVVGAAQQLLLSMAKQGWLWKKAVSKTGSSCVEEVGGASGGSAAVANLFHRLDRDGSGTLSAAELRQLGRELGRELSKKELHGLLEELGVIDGIGERQVALLDFEQWWNRKAKATFGPSVVGRALTGGLPGALAGKVPLGRGPWSRRWFRVVGEQLRYYKDAEAAVVDDATGTLPLSKFAVRDSLPTGEDGKEERPHGLSLVGIDNEFVMAAENMKDRLEWLDQLQTHIEKIWLQGKTELPGNLRTRGQLYVTPAAWAESSRDFTRTFTQSDSLQLMGPLQAQAGRQEPIYSRVQAGGNVNEEVTAAAAADFEAIMVDALDDHGRCASVRTW